MAEIIHIREILEERRRARSRLADQHNLEAAVSILRENLVVAAAELRDAPAELQSELLSRVERLAALIRYGMRMLPEPSPSPLPISGLPR